MHDQSPVNSGTPQPGSVRSSISSRACDACRGRRRRCHFDNTLSPNAEPPGSAESQPQPKCYNCRRLGLTCSFLLPSRPRGPKRRKRLSEDMSGDGGSELHPEPPIQPPVEQHSRSTGLDNATGFVLPGDVLPLPRTLQATSPSFGAPNAISNVLHPHPAITAPDNNPTIAGPRFPTDELCSRALINTLMVDYLDLVYPLVPVVHRPNFRQDLANNRDITDPDFFALLVSLCALTVGLLPSRFRDYRAIDPEAGMHFETRTALINCCAEMCTRQRPHSYWDHVNHRKWAVSYVFSVATFQTGQVNRSRMFDVEYLQLSRLLGLHRISEYEGLNCIETQLRKKAFWLLFYGYAHTRVQSGRWERLTYFGPGELREVNFDALVPLEIDDEYILRDRILDPLSPTAATHTHGPPTTGGQSEATPAPPFTLASAFIIHSRVFLKGLRESMATTGCECELRRTPAARLARMRDLLQEMRYMLDDAPGPMRQWASPGRLQDDPATPRCDDDRASSVVSSFGSPVERRPNRAVGVGEGDAPCSKVVQGQLEIMRANIHVTHLWLQSLLLEQIDVVIQEKVIGGAAAGAAGAEEVSSALKANWAEREDICRQMLHLLHSIPYVYLEPNGLYLAYKVRDVAVTLLNCPFEANTRPAIRAVEYTRDFTQILSRLDRSEIVNTNSLRSWVDVDREPAVVSPQCPVVPSSPHGHVGASNGCDKNQTQY
ncbi:hypothetical protein KVR01_011758 [Diaporthe batatas]|uniref:uncharacterized protein n=1 Tax=Diaporthe batatas TaxID=748121 RepID=UPI001D04651B|nr:uncharacterized protein KVR01_011758 [Diaporthe batatas]KAG8158636.1 hypothetical protein KVR01_011758 [Diaporthe batatas]